MKLNNSYYSQGLPVLHKIHFHFVPRRFLRKVCPSRHLRPQLVQTAINEPLRVCSNTPLHILQCSSFTRCAINLFIDSVRFVLGFRFNIPSWRQILRYSRPIHLPSGSSAKPSAIICPKQSSCLYNKSLSGSVILPPFFQK